MKRNDVIVGRCYTNGTGTTREVLEIIPATENTIPAVSYYIRASPTGIRVGLVKECGLAKFAAWARTSWKP